jgi:hypothetical protein
MSTSKKPRKPYRPKPVGTPITRGLLDSFAQELHFSLLTARAGHFNTTSFDKIGGTLNVIWGALELRKPQFNTERLVIEGGMRTMNEVADRGDKTGTWMLTLTQIATVTAAANKAEEALQFLNVLDLYRSMQKLREVRAEERRAA